MLAWGDLLYKKLWGIHIGTRVVFFYRFVRKWDCMLNSLEVSLGGFMQLLKFCGCITSHFSSFHCRTILHQSKDMKEDRVSTFYPLDWRHSLTYRNLIKGQRALRKRDLMLTVVHFPLIINSAVLEKQGPCPWRCFLSVEQGLKLTESWSELLLLIAAMHRFSPLAALQKLAGSGEVT